MAGVIAGRRFVVTGGRGAFGAPLMELLRDGGADVTTLGFGTDWGYDDYSAFDALLPDCDVLVLAHGAKVEQAMDANCTSFVALIERYRALRGDGSLEVWAVGSEIECHPDWGNAELKIYKDSKMAYARFARRYAKDRGLVYRHIVPSAFTSPMGPGLISGRTAARWALGLIKLGLRYIPVTYTGIACANWFRHTFGERATDSDVEAITDGSR